MKNTGILNDDDQGHTFFKSRRLLLVETLCLLLLSLALLQSHQELQADASAPVASSAPIHQKRRGMASKEKSMLAEKTVQPTGMHKVSQRVSQEQTNGDVLDNNNYNHEQEQVQLRLPEPYKSMAHSNSYHLETTEKRTKRSDKKKTGSQRTSGAPPAIDDVLVVAAVDGTIAAISRTSGKTLWRRSKNIQEPWGLSESEAPLFDPLISTTTSTRVASDTEGRRWRTSAVPSLDGKVFLTAPPLREKLDQDEEESDETADVTVTTTVGDLVSRAPFVDNRGRMYTGSRKSIAVALDSMTGQVLQVVAADSQCSAMAEDHQVIWLGRVDNSISIQDPRTGAVDVKFSSAKIISVNDMMLGSISQHQQPWYFADHRAYMLPEGDESSHLPVLVATPNGVLAYLNPETGRIVWVAEERFDSPVAFGVHAASGTSLALNIVPDAAMPNGSKDYVVREIERQLKLKQQNKDDHDIDDEEEQTIIGSLPSGQVYAIPLGSRTSKQAGFTQDTASLDQPHRPLISGRDSEPDTCRPGSVDYPYCRSDAFAYRQSSQEGAIVPFYHPDFGYIPPEHFYTLKHQKDTDRRKYKKVLRILGSWLPPTIALIFVLSFELGRRKRLNEFKLTDAVASDVVKTSVDGTTNSWPDGPGVIQVCNDVILGYGAHGTVVFRGELDGRQVAVKRMLKTYHASADREISLLIESDGHSNVVRYFLKEVRGDFVYLALELCELSLHDLISTLRSRYEQDKRKDGVVVPTALRTILYQIACGVQHLHHLRIVHRDLKPANILLADSRNSKARRKKQDTETVYETFLLGYYVAKISDMGLGKQLIGQSSYGASLINEASFRSQANGAVSSVAGAGPGSVGWQAPEVMALRASSDVSAPSDGSNLYESGSDPPPADSSTNPRTSRSVDIFSLGCIFYSALVPGSHPFGEWYEREANIMHNRPSIDALKDVSVEAHDLVAAMIQRDPSCRPTAKQICDHPFFWSPEKRLSFICEFSDRLETDCDNSTQVTKLLAVETGAVQVIGSSWDRILDAELVSNVQKFRTYDPASVRDLLRLIRNKYHHFDEFSPTMKETLKSKTEGLVAYFEERFPNLLIHCFRVCRELLEADDPLSTKYSIASYGPKRKLKVPTISEAVAPVELAIERSSLQPQEDKNISISDANLGPVAEIVHQGLGESFNEGAASISDASQTQLSACLNAGLPPASVMLTSFVSENELASRAPDVGDVVIWHGSTAAKTLCCRGWNRSDEEWIRRVDTSLRKRDNNLVRCAEDPKFRTRLCNHWDVSLGTVCPMRKKNKCVFAHGPIELRVKEPKRNRWGKLVDENGDNNNPNHSGGEDTYGAARSIEVTRKQEGKWNTDVSEIPNSDPKGKPKPQSTKKKKASAR